MNRFKCSRGRLNRGLRVGQKCVDRSAHDEEAVSTTLGLDCMPYRYCNKIGTCMHAVVSLVKSSIVSNSEMFRRDVEGWQTRSRETMHVYGCFPLINTARPVRTVKLFNGTQNVWASDLFDRKN